MSRGGGGALPDTRRMREAWASTGTLREAAAELGCSHSGMLRMARRCGYPHRHAVVSIWGEERRSAWIAAAPDPEPVVANLAAKAPLSPAFGADPRWSLRRDLEIVQSQGSYARLAELAREWNLSLAAVQARWHRLRVAA